MNNFYPRFGGQMGWNRIVYGFESEVRNVLIHLENSEQSLHNAVAWYRENANSPRTMLMASIWLDTIQQSCDKDHRRALIALVRELVLDIYFHRERIVIACWMDWIQQWVEVFKEAIKGVFLWQTELDYDSCKQVFFKWCLLCAVPWQSFNAFFGDVDKKREDFISRRAQGDGNNYSLDLGAQASVADSLTVVSTTPVSVMGTVRGSLVENRNLIRTPPTSTRSPGNLSTVVGSGTPLTFSPFRPQPEVSSIQHAEVCSPGFQHQQTRVSTPFHQIQTSLLTPGCPTIVVSLSPCGSQVIVSSSPQQTPTSFVNFSPRPSSSMNASMTACAEPELSPIPVINRVSYHHNQYRTASSMEHSPVSYLVDSVESATEIETETETRECNTEGSNSERQEAGIFEAEQSEDIEEYDPEYPGYFERASRPNVSYHEPREIPRDWTTNFGNMDNLNLRAPIGRRGRGTWAAVRGYFTRGRGWRGRGRGRGRGMVRRGTAGFRHHNYNPYL